MPMGVPTKTRFCQKLDELIPQILQATVYHLEDVNVVQAKILSLDMHLHQDTILDFVYL